MSNELPQAFFDNSVEFVEHDDIEIAIQKGKLFPIDVMPSNVHAIMVADMQAHPFAEEAFADWKITDQELKLKKYINCRYSKCDNHPDIDQNGNVQPAENVNCPNRFSCKWYGLFCVGVQGVNGTLSTRQVEVLSLIGQDKADKVICAELGIKQPTLRNHKNIIEERTGVKGKVAMSLLAVKYNLIKI